MEYFVADYAEFQSPLLPDNIPNNNNLNNNNIPNNVNNNNNNGQFMVDDLLDFSSKDDDENDDEKMTDAFFAVNSGDNSSTVTAVDSCNSSGDGDCHFNGNVSSRSFNESHFNGNELCVPYDDLAELEWLSNFVEESFSTDDLHHFIPTQNVAIPTKTNSSSSVTTATHAPPNFPSDVSVPGKARSKRSRAAPCDWSSRLLHLTPSAHIVKSEPSKPTRGTDPMDQNQTPGRKCLHCLSEKTPQWRTGPMGPKTLCNACGVRYKSGRLVPEYRPASSPTFVSTKHSNSHRKVMELRRQKEVHVPQHHHHHPQLINQASIFNGCDEFLIHHRSSINGPDFRHMM